MSSFTPDQVGHFRQEFTQFSDEELGGVCRSNFIPAVEASLEQCNFAGSPPSHEYLDNEFQRIAGDDGVIQWQQFFQVLIHLNLRQSASPPPEELRHVQFSSEFPVNEEPPPPSYDQLAQDASGSTATERANTLGRHFLRSVGGFFGLTEASQRGEGGEIGWQEFTERNFEENAGGGILRRGSLRNRVQHQQRPPSYPAVTTGRSFDLEELGGDSDEDEMGFTAAPPPHYMDVVGTTGAGVEGVVIIEEQQQYPEPTRAADSSAADRPADLIYNQREAWEYYLKFTKAEKKARQRRHRTDAYDFFGSAEGGAARNGPAERSGSIRRERLHSLDQGQEVVRRRPKKTRRTKLERQSTLIRTEVESLPTFWPVFIVFVSIAQLVAVAVLLPIYRLAPIKLFPIEETTEFPSLLTVNDSNVTYYRGINLWIGVRPLDLIRLGAKFSPCMRRDFEIRRTVNVAIRDTVAILGCCQNGEHVGTVVPNGCVTPTNAPATNSTFFQGGVRCSDNTSMAASQGGANFHPCCISITGQCAVMDFAQCEARGGFFHQDMDSCDEVDCFKDICGFGGALIGEEINSNTGQPDPLAPVPQQFWRYFTSTYLHLGVIHIIIIIPIQLYIGIKIERTVGFLRVAIIYTLSGVGGNLLSAIFIPYGVSAGASGAVFGLLGVLYVELFQFWQIVDRAWLELLKLSAFVVFLLTLGTLPYVDNMSHVGGLLFGVPSAIIFVPYITFGKWDAARKRILLVICIPLLILMFLVGFLTFYLIPTPDFCSFCHYINCAYSAALCPAEFTMPNSNIFSL